MGGRPLAQCLGLALSAALLALAPAFAAPGPPDPSAALATAVKATYLDKLGAFITWPAGVFTSPADPARLCLVGDDPFGPLIDQAVQGQRIAAHPIQLVRLDRVDKGAGCLILFAAGSARQSAADALDKVHGAPVLTVTDGAADPAQRGVINFVLRNNRVRFEIDEAGAAQSGLSISSKLLSLAVRPEE